MNNGDTGRPVSTDQVKDYQPDYRRVVDTAYRQPVDYIPLYEHNISIEVVEQIVDKPLSQLLEGDAADKAEYFRVYGDFCCRFGYDVVPYEGAMVELVQKGLGVQGRAKPLVSSREDILKFPWDEIPHRYFEMYGPVFRALTDNLPTGMKAVGGVGYGVFETVQDFVPMTDLAFLEIDDPEAFQELWWRVGDMMCAVWKKLLAEHGDTFALCRMGDDLGFKSSLLIKPSTFHEHILPQYKKIIALVHEYKKPFLLHSCGSIWEIMDTLIEEVGIDAKHSNEDEIAPFTEWVQRYGDRIALFGGLDMNVLCNSTEREIKKYVRDVLDRCDAIGKPGLSGIAFGSGNQIASYVPPEGFIAMVEAVREYRRE